MNHAHLCTSGAGADEIQFADDSFTSQALAERRGRAKRAHAKGLFATVLGGIAFLTLARAFVRSVR